METTIQNIRKILINTINTSKNDLVDILNKTGIPTSYQDSKKKIRENVIKGLSISNNFVEQMKELIMKNHISDVKNAMGSEAKTLGFASQPLYQATVDFGSGLIDIDPNHETISFKQVPTQTTNVAMSGTFGANGTFGADGTIHPTANPFGSDFSFRASGFGANGSEEPTKKTFFEKAIDWLNNALGIYGEVIKNNPTTEQEKLANLQAQLDAEKKKSRNAWILPTVLTAIITGTIVYMVAKKK
jgi:hypothetical protein